MPVWTVRWSVATRWRGQRAPLASLPPMAPTEDPPVSPFRGLPLVLALAWIAGVSLLYLAARELALPLVP
jgi:hypothetical protein